MAVKLFLISQNKNNDYDTYDSAVVAAPDEAAARNTNPENGKPMNEWDRYSSWCFGPEQVTVRYIGEAVDVEQGVVCASFHAS
jgi:hypothetical protein